MSKKEEYARLIGVCTGVPTELLERLRVKPPKPSSKPAEPAEPVDDNIPRGVPIELLERLHSKRKYPLTTGHKKMTPKKQWYLMGAIALAVTVALASCDGNSDTPGGDIPAVQLSDSERAAIEAQAHADAASTPAESAADVIAAKVSPDIFEEYTADDYPKLYKQLGNAGVKEAQKGARAAAYKAALADDCKTVQIASVMMESTKKHMEFFVNCESDSGNALGAKQWHFKAAELKDSKGHWLTAKSVTAPGESETDKNKREMAAQLANNPASYSQCEQAVRAQLDYPSAAEFHYMTGRAEFVNPHNENVIKVNFEAKAETGAMLPKVANCIFTHDGGLTVDIFNR